MTRDLLAHPGIDVNTANKAGDTPLITVVDKGYTTVAEMLLAHPDINVNSRNKGGKTAFHHVIRYGGYQNANHRRMTRLLLSKDSIEI
ncbi:hypothetical protein SERLA73DRAFT_133535, partial [Serpula lacrymans var. lacrymans S7.3]